MTTIRKRLESLTPCQGCNLLLGHGPSCPARLRPALLALIADAQAEERERCAKWHDEQARGAEKYAANVRANWMGDDISEDDRRDNSLDAWKHTQIASDHKRYAAAIRSLGQGDENG